jgi:hypothetical protein
MVEEPHSESAAREPNQAGALAPDSGENGTPTSRTTVRSAPTKRLPTPRISFNNQLNIARAYGALSQGGAKAVDHKDVATMLKMAADTVSLANPFLADVGLITRVDSGYMASPELVAFARVYQWEPEKAAHELAPKLRDTWFANVLLDQLTFATVMDEQSAITELAKAAEADTAYRPQLRTLIDYLAAAGLVIDEGGSLKAVASPKPGSTPTTVREGATEHSQPSPARSAPAAPAVATGLPLLIQGLLQQLPSGDQWSAEDMEAWLTLARNVFQVVYKIPASVEKAGGSP